MSLLAVLLCLSLVSALVLLPLAYYLNSTWVIRFYIWGLFIILSFGVIQILGLEKHRSPQLSRDDQLLVSHVGYYIAAAPGNRFVFSGDRKADGFYHPAFAGNEKLIVEPAFPLRTGIQWKLRYESARTYPLRLNEECVNAPGEWWLNPGDNVTIRRGKAGRRAFFRLKWESETGFFGNLKNKYKYSQGIIHEDGTEEFQCQDVLLTRRVLSDGYRLSTIAALSQQNEFRDCVKNSDWWNEFERIALIRKLRGDKTSAIGVFLDESLLLDPNLEILKNGSLLNSRIQDRELPVGPSTVIDYGLDKDRLSLRITDQTASDSVWGEIIEVKLNPDKSWPLPPKPPGAGTLRPFIITSSNGYIPLDGYTIELGDSFVPFYAKATLNPENSQNVETHLTINDGISSKQYGLEETIRLGDYQKGISLTLKERKPAISHPGWWAIGILFLNALVFTLVQLGSLHHKTRIAWTGIWGMTVAILMVRLVLSYRASLLPPIDANIKELENVFQKGFSQSLIALLAIPALLALTPPIVRGISALINLLLRRRPAQAQSINFPFVIIGYLLITLSALWIIVEAKLSGSEAVLGERVRANLAINVLIILGIVLLSRILTAKRVTLSLWIVALSAMLVLIVGTTAGMVLAVKDFGFIVFLPSFVIVLVALAIWHKERRAARIGIIIICALFSFFYLIPGLFSLPAVQSAIYPISDRVFYRLAAQTGEEEAILLQRSSSNDFNIDALLNNSQQNWQMLLYASHGGWSGAGFGKVPMTKRAMSHPTSLSDCIFSVYLLSEHGISAAIFLLLHYIGITASCLYGGYSLPRKSQHNLLPLIAIGAYFACAALYIASANTGFLPFTGQNIPMLSPHSRSDLWLSGFLVMLAAYLLNPSSAAQQQGHVSLRFFNRYVIAGLLIWAASLGLVTLPRLVEEAKSRRNSDQSDDFNFKKGFYQRIEDQLPRSDKTTALRMSGDIIEVVHDDKVSAVERLFIDQFNERPKDKKYDESAGFYYLDRSSNSNSNDSSLRVNKTYYLLRSPFSEESIWKGSVVPARTAAEPTFLSLGSAFSVSLANGGHAETVSLDGQSPSITNRVVNISSAGTTFGTLKRDDVDHSRVMLEPKQGDWKIYIEGKQVSTGSIASVDLNPLDIIVINQGRRRWNLMYLGLQGPVFAHVEWRNGRYSRLYPLGDIFPLAYALGKAGDEIKGEQTSQLQGDLKLTIEVSLQRELQQAIESYAAINPHYAAGDPLNTDRVAVAVVVPSTGELVALPSWPKKNPNDADFEKLLREASPNQEIRLVGNHNFTDHAVGSTIKPVVFSSVATQLWPSRDLSDVIAFNHPDRGTGKHPHTQLAGLNIGTWDCFKDVNPINSADFLIHSLDYYEGFVGMLGMVYDARDFDQALVNQNGLRLDLRYRNRDFTFDLTRLPPGRVPFTVEDQIRDNRNIPRPLTSDMNRTLLFRGLQDCFGISLSVDPALVRKESCQAFLPSFWSQSLDPSKSVYLDNILPSPAIFSPKDFQTTRGDLISFLLGSGPARLTNIKMAEIGGTLLTGRRVPAHLEYVAPGAINSFTVPVPLGDNLWRSRHVIDPMLQVAEVGTASALTGTTNPYDTRLPLIPSPYRVMVKTGTIEERENGRESEFLLFVVGEWDRDHFIEGRTLSCFFYMQDSKVFGIEATAQKMELARRLLPKLIDYLEHY